MPLKKISLKTTQQNQKQRLDQVLSELLPQVLKQPLSKAKVRKLIVAGAVYLNGKRVRIASKEMMPNAKLDIYIDFEKLNSGPSLQDRAFVMSDSHILFEDEHLIAVNKPPGLPTQPTLDEARDNLFAAVKKFLLQRAGGKDSHLIYLGLHHRLDRDTSGVILFTKTREANPGISEAFSKHQAIKVYQALTSFKPSSPLNQQWDVKNYLGRAKTGGKRSKFNSVRSGGDFAHTDFKLMETTPSGLWVEARPRTGRTHQIRVHLSEGGYPILGDSTYGGMTKIGKYEVPRLMLHAVNLTFPHPINKNNISVQSPLPEDFQQCLNVLQRGGPVF